MGVLIAMLGSLFIAEEPPASDESATTDEPAIVETASIEPPAVLAAMPVEMPCEGSQWQCVTLTADDGEQILVRVELPEG